MKCNEPGWKVTTTPRTAVAPGTKTYTVAVYMRRRWWNRGPVPLALRTWRRLKGAR
jgi:hypothetical protein